MITSDRQLNVTRKKIQEMEETLKSLAKAKSSPLQKASKIQTQALLKELYAEVEEYQVLKEKGLDAIKLDDISEVMLLPIKYRIAKDMTQEAFAKKVDIPLRMIARYESEGYRNITGENFHKILQKLHLKSFGKLKEA